MTAARNPDDYCYRHPDRLSFVLCEKCARTICLECQNRVDGHVLCPDDAARLRSNVTPISAKRRARRRIRIPALNVQPDTPVASYVLIGAIVGLWLIDLIVGGLLELQLIFIPGLEKARPWTLVTSLVSVPGGGDGFLTALFGGYTLYLLGTRFERTLGRRRFLTLFLLGGFGGAVSGALFSGVVYASNSAIFGLLGAALILLRADRQSRVWIYIAVALTFIQIALSSSRAFLWQGCLGSLIIGAAIAYSYTLDGSTAGARRQKLIIGGVSAILILLALFRVLAP